MRSRGARARLVAALAVVALLATACQRVQITLYGATRTPSLALRYVTRDGSDAYRFAVVGDRLRVSASATNNGSQSRAVVWPPGTKLTTDQESCATWTDETGARPQEGLALRVRVDGTRFRSIVVAKNVWYGASWQMNVYTWDSDRDPYLQIAGAVPLSTPFVQGSTPRAFPWHVCARVEGSIVTVKGWRDDEAEPSWTDASHTGAVRLPNGWVFQGKAGWYAGHLDPGATMGMADVHTSAWEVRPDA